MPRGTPKRGAFEFKIWFANGSRIEWASNNNRAQTDAEIAAAIRRYLLPVAERIESRPAVDAVDPHVGESNG